ncbi:MAG TPA: ATP-binding protein [Silvibacterium sp.]|jgi:signal transduction histidine kinase|nr:ATP-binding protein [Silvibacterium sp.]
MLTLYQRLILGCLLLIALVTGVSMLVRTSFVQLAALDASQHTADAALAALAAVRASLAGEELIAAKLESGTTPQLSSQFTAQAGQTQNLLNTASATVESFDHGISLDELKTRHAKMIEHGPDGFNRLAPQLEEIGTDLTRKFETLKARHDAVVGSLERQQALLRARLISACGASIAAAIVIAVVMTFFVITPVRRTARAAKRIGQGDLQQRIEWRQKDDLGTIATELNRMVVRLRDLRETESGRLQMEHQLSDAVVQSIFEPVIVTDAKGRVLKLNQASSELLGEGSSDRMVLANTPGGEKILDAVRMAVSMQHASTSEGEAALLPMRVGKAQRSYRLRTTPMRDSEGKLLGAVTVLEDVTELQEVDRFKTRFLSVASQKLRDPLQRLRLSLYALSRGHAGELRPLQTELIRSAEQEAEQLSDLMADLIEVGELETGRRELKIERLRPVDILREAISRHEENARTKKIELQLNVFADLAHVNADRRALRSILDNLMVNALRYTPECGIILLEAAEIKDGVQFFVRDNGRGIETERLRTIFGRFSGGSDEGTGLGLALVRRLVESLGGQVSVESKLGNGTTFSFTLPIATVTASRHPVEIG